jgi:opacity protein-like surface antigen
MTMKKRVIFIVLGMSVFSAAKGQFTKVGIGLNYGTGFHFNNETSGSLADLYRSPFTGISVKGIYELKLHVQLAPSFTWFVPRTNRVSQSVSNESTKVSSMMFDLNGQWVFSAPGRFGFYAQTGLNITFTGIKWPDRSSNGNDNAIGLNLGTGTSIKLTEQLDFSAELKYIVSKYDQVMLNAGVLLNLQRLKKNQNH